MTINTIVTIALVITVLAVMGAETYLYVRRSTLDDIRQDVYQLFLMAEHNPKFANVPKERMVWVLKQARGLLPSWAQMFITDAFLAKVVQGWFDAIKDLLDDGRLNGSGKGDVE